VKRNQFATLPTTADVDPIARHGRVPNTSFRDAAPFESTGGYNGMHVEGLGPIVESIEHVRQLRPEVYPEVEYPSFCKSRRYRNVFDFCMDTVTIDRSYPAIGDGGVFHGQEGEVSTSGIELTKQEGGTPAGPDVPYGDTEWLKANGCSLHPTYGWRGLNFVFPHLYNVERGVAQGPWSADWRLKTDDELHMRLTVVEARSGAGRPPVEVNIADGTSPAGGKPYEMKWVMMHSRGEAPARTQALSLIEPYLGQPIIREVQMLPLSEKSEMELGAVACRIQLADRIDTLFCAEDPAVEHAAEGGFRFAGRRLPQPRRGRGSLPLRADQGDRGIPVKRPVGYLLVNKIPFFRVGPCQAIQVTCPRFLYQEL